MSFYFLKYKRYYLIISHIIVWALFYIFNTRLFINANLPFFPEFQLFNTILYALVFYINYFFVVKLLLQKKFLLYILFSLALLLIGISGLTFIDQQIKTEVRGKFGAGEIRNPREPHPFGEDRRPMVKDGSVRKHFDNRKMFGMAYSLFFFFFLSLTIRLFQKWLEDEKAKSQLEAEKVQTELAYLKHQINPHFLFNSLNSIYSLSLSRSEKTTPSILKLSSILRYLLYDSSEIAASLEKELMVVQDYIELQKLRLTEKVKVDVLIEGEPEDYLFEPFIILPIIENAFKYGVDNLNNSYILIVLKIEEAQLYLNVENKVVQRPAMKRSASGIGLKNIKRRLEILYPKQHQFSSKENNEIFSVEMIIKLRK